MLLALTISEVDAEFNRESTDGKKCVDLILEISVDC